MKKVLSIILILALALGLGSTAFAEPTPATGGSASPTPAVSSGLIKYKDTGETVVRIQIRLRDLGYFNYKPTGNFANMTVESTIKFQQMQVDDLGQAIIADGTVGDQSLSILFGMKAKRGEITASIPFGKALEGEAAVTGKLMNWSQVSALLVQGTSYTITDYNTGTEFSMTYTGGENHAEMECPSPAQAAIYKEVFGGEYNYSKRPVVIDISGQLIAASLQGYPHGEDAVAANDMDGHSCLFFEGSLSHVGMLPDVEHLNQIYRAAGRS